MSLQPSPHVPELVQGWVGGIDGGAVLVIRHDIDAGHAELWLQDADRCRMAGARLDLQQVEAAVALLADAARRLRGADSGTASG